MNYMNKTLKLSALLMSFFFLPGCNCDRSAPEVAPTKAAPSKMIVVNVADQDTFGECHIKGSVQMDFDKVESTFANVDKNMPIVTYCANYQCTASGAVAQMLTEMGFTNVKAFEGGMAQWFQKGYPVEGKCTHMDKKSVSSYLTAENVKHEDGQDDGIVEITIDQLYNEMKQAGLLA